VERPSDSPPNPALIPCAVGIVIGAAIRVASCSYRLASRDGVSHGPLVVGGVRHPVVRRRSGLRRTVMPGGSTAGSAVALPIDEFGTTVGA
jgi:hypothetical protein